MNEIIVGEKDQDIRLDIFIRNKMKKHSRTYIQSLIKNGRVLVNNKKEKSNYKVVKNDIILVDDKENKLKIKEENIEFNIIYEDEFIAVIEKEAGMIVHPTTHKNTGTIVNGLLYHFDNLSKAGEDYRPGIVHRLDKDTSGILVIAKNNESYYNLVDQFKSRKVYREYIAIVDGSIIPNEGIIDKPIGRDVNNRTKMKVTDKNSKRSITKYMTKEFLNNYTLLKVNLITGRMHQIRVHLNYIGHPVVGDRVYNNKSSKTLSSYQLLHAYKIGILHPKTNEYMEFKTEMPDRFMEFIKKYKK